ncbi:NAD-dependent epimerase/dehydratase family protein [Flavobacterium geliluteum]|uniref:NAD(P)H-binding protein n=1 Tax=Flavobacterium geliluteum TaxID=2816120 RepID=A0A941AW26_9FLAO|nr:NAD-dependent epimerase/dehydratase family protein [Flavobacterium geliluteum]MBP4137035.1 NAD(P)H-binding protein [Flavobacterium geliluteum]
MTHTILGANGTIATELIPVLKKHNVNIRLVSRTPQHVEGTESITADALDSEQLLSAILGSDVVYLTIGLVYNAKIWEEQWPVIMRNVINACKTTGAKLVFFDNIYMYGKVDGIITEETPYNYISKKGKVRAELAKMLLKEMASGNIEATIARAADFFGPRATEKSIPSVLVFEKLKAGSTAQWLINPNVPRSLNYTPDIAEALYILATNEKAFGQVWHLPTPAPLTGKEFVKLAAKHLKSSDKISVLPKWLLKIIGLLNPFMKEAYEMNYQNEFPLHLSSAKFEKAFAFKPTSYEDAVKETALWHLNR